MAFLLDEQEKNDVATGMMDGGQKGRFRISRSIATEVSGAQR
jgi:ABC-type polar amino acid transport system ATPase subunit